MQLMHESQKAWLRKTAAAENFSPAASVVYVVCKGAVLYLARWAAFELSSSNIRVNAISAGPVKTLAAAGISGFSSILNVYRDRAPLRRNIETCEVGDAAAFLLSDAGRGITGEVLMVDAGFHITGM